MNKLLVICGPTGVGKTEFAANLANKLNAEIISADSRQVYKEMSIGTAKPTILQQKKAKHFLLDQVSPEQAFSLSDYQRLAYDSIDQVITQGKKAMLVGGTGLYIQAVVDGLKIPKVAPNPKLRQELEDLPTEDLLVRLRKLDPESFQKIPEQNRRRLIRAIEVTETTGQPFSILGRQYHRLYDSLQIGLTAPRQELYQRVDTRVDKWIEEGWIDEVKNLKDKYPSHLPSMTSLGYRQIGMYLDGKISLEEASKRIKFDIHSFIRRQMTWFRRDGRIIWFDTTEPSWQEDIEKKVKSWYAEDNESI